MATYEIELAPPPPTDTRQRELWLQHAAGVIRFADVRKYALERLDPTLDEGAVMVATKAIDDTLYG
ncbi:hypothetical protein [Pendulispora albinea]|uniref:Uncharacterized protein n=1 Tax=Pendulispora albinea TaxID=2741071 RepID=A0ABZ2M722_9BACT